MSQNEPDREAAFRRFFLALRIAFKTAPMYPADHPAFLKALEDLHDNLKPVLALAPVLTIKFSPRTLFADGRFWDQDRVAADLAHLFHLRRILSLDVRAGIPMSELRAFAVKVTRPVEEIVHSGGLRAALKKDGLDFISVEELDYSQLLKGEGEEIRDLWPYLLIEAAEAAEPDKMEMFAQRLQSGSVLVDPKTILQREDVQAGLAKLFTYVRDQGEDRFRVCAKTVVRSLVTAKQAPVEEKLVNIRTALSGLRDEDLASALWEQVIEIEDFDATGFAVFSQIVPPERHAGVSSSLQQLVRADRAARRGPEVRAKILSLLTGEDGPYVSGVYRRTLAGLLQEMTFEEKQEFDRPGVDRHYRTILLNLIDRDEDPASSIRNLDLISGELPRIAETKDWGFFRDLLDVLRCKEPSLAFHAPFKGRMEAILLFVEDLILGGAGGPEFDIILPLVGKIVRGEEEILNRIFDSPSVTPTVMKHLIQNGPPDFERWQERIIRTGANSPVLDSIADALAEFDSRPTVEILKLLYASGSPNLRLKVLSQMRSQAFMDEPFLHSILRSEDPRLRAGALSTLMRTERTRNVALERLLAGGSPFGRKNRTILQNLDIIERLDIREAAPRLRALASRAGLWNAAIRRAARQILGVWHEG